MVYNINDITSANTVFVSAVLAGDLLIPACARERIKRTKKTIFI